MSVTNNEVSDLLETSEELLKPDYCVVLMQHSFYFCVFLSRRNMIYTVTLSDIQHFIFHLSFNGFLSEMSIHNDIPTAAESVGLSQVNGHHQ